MMRCQKNAISKTTIRGKMLRHCADCLQSEQSTPAHPSIFSHFRLAHWPKLTHHGLEGFGSQIIVADKVNSGQTLHCTHMETPLICSSGGGFVGWVGER